MNPEQHTDYQAFIEKLQSDIDGLKTQLSYLTHTQMEFTNSELETSRLEWQPTKAQLNEVLTEQFVGVVCAFAMPSPPLGWLECNGQTVSRTEYARLFNKIGTTFGAGDDETTFNLPDLRGVFVRGWERVAGGHDSGRDFGTYQDDQLQTHSHTDSGHSHSGSTHSDGSHSHSASTNSAGGHSHSGSMSKDGEHFHMFGKYEDEDLVVTGFYPTKNPNVATAKLTGCYGKILLGYSELKNASAVEIGGYPGFNNHVEISGSHTHSLSTDSVDSHSHNVEVSLADSHSHSMSIDNGQANLGNPINARFGNETRPQNVALLFGIKY